MNKIKLVWVSKFRELIEIKHKSIENIISEYLEYCNKEEKEINERIEKVRK